jgi:hypothetical protein
VTLISYIDPSNSVASTPVTCKHAGQKSRRLERSIEEVGGDENRRPFIPEPDDDEALYSRPPPKKGIQKQPEEPTIRNRSISIPTTAADRDREAAPATGNGSDHQSDWNEVQDTDGLEDGLELMSRK